MQIALRCASAGRNRLWGIIVVVNDCLAFRFQLHNLSFYFSYRVNGSTLYVYHFRGCVLQRGHLKYLSKPAETADDSPTTRRSASKSEMTQVALLARHNGGWTNSYRTFIVLCTLVRRHVDKTISIQNCFIVHACMQLIRTLSTLRTHLPCGLISISFICNTRLHR